MIFFDFFFLKKNLRFFTFEGSVHSGRSKVTRIMVGRDTNQSFRVCKVNLATLNVANILNLFASLGDHFFDFFRFFLLFEFFFGVQEGFF